MRRPRHLSRLAVVLGALALFLAAPPAVASKAKPAVTKKAKPDKLAKTRSQAAKKGWETRRMNQKASANWAMRVAKNPSADKPGARDAFFKRSLSAQRGIQNSKVRAKTPAMAKAKSKKLVKKTSKKTTKKTTKKRQARTGSKKSRAPRPAKNETAVAGVADAQQRSADLDRVVDEVGLPDQGAPADQGPGRFGRFARKFGKAALGVGIAVGVGAIGFAGGWALFPVIGGLTALGGIPGTAIVGAVMGGGLGAGTASYFLRDRPARMAQQEMGGDDAQGADLLRRYATRRMLENHNLNGAGPGGGIFGPGGLTQPGQLGNMIDPGGNN